MGMGTIGKLLKSSGVGACILALLFTGSLFIIASGGGGGGGVDTGFDPSGPDATLTQSNSDDAAGSALSAMDMGETSSSMGGVGALSVSGRQNSPVMSIVKLTLARSNLITRQAQTQGRAATDVPVAICDNSGTASMTDMTEIPLDDLISGNYSINFTYVNCDMGGTIFDGTLSTQMATDNMTVTTQSFSTEDVLTGDTVTMTQFSIVTDQMVYAGDELVGGRITIRGNVQGQLEGQTVDQSYDNIVIEFDDLGTQTQASINGDLMSNCMGGWATITTTETFVYPNDQLCPTAGALDVSSAGHTAGVEIESGVITITFDDTQVGDAYTDCTEVKGMCSN